MSCHHCGQPFTEDETRILADVLVTGGSRVERIAIHEVCIPEDRLLCYAWENMMVERVRGAGPERA